MSEQPANGSHGVQFYDTEAFLCDSVSSFLADGLIAGEPVVVLATEPHRQAFARELASRGFDWDRARRSRRLRWMDARAALETIMIGRVPDRQRFDEHIGGWIRAGLRESGDGEGGSPTRVRAYGELVDLLWREGNADAALVLEDYWNDFAGTLSLSLLCAYSRGNIYRESRGQRRREVCERHTHVLPDEEGQPVAAG